MKPFTMSEHAACSPGRAWEVLMDMSKAPRWRALTRRMELIGDGPVRVGSRYRLEMEVQGKRITRESEVVEYDPPRHITLHSAKDGLFAWFDYRVEPEGDGTRITLAIRLATDRFWPRLVLPLIARGERAVRAEQLGKLKRVIEESA